MKRYFNPVDVKLNIENPFIERDAFYRLCFITESDIAPRTLKVTRLQDLLESGYSRLDLVYNFCVGVFSQQSMDTVYIRAKRSSESYVEAYNSDDNSMYYFVVLQTKNLTEIEKFNGHLVSSDEMKLQFFSQNVGSKILQSPKLVNYFQDYTRPEGGVSSGDKDYYLNKAYEGSDAWVKIPLPDYLLEGYGDDAVDYGVGMMVGKDYIWEIDKAGRRIKYAPEVLQQGWAGSKEESTIVGSDISVVAYKGSEGVSKKSTVLNPKVKIETLSRELLKGLGKEVLDYAIPLIDPEATDWVLDPANNSIKYKTPNPISEFLWGYDNGVIRVPYVHPTALDAAKALCVAKGDVFAYELPDEPTRAKCKRSTNGSLYSSDFVKSQRNPDYDSSAPTTGENYIPIDTVAQKVIENADDGHLESKEFLKSIPLFAYILTGSGTEAVNKAVLDIDPEATDWVLDPDNNRIKYTDSGGGSWSPEICVYTVVDDGSKHNSLSSAIARIKQNRGAHQGGNCVEQGNNVVCLSPDGNSSFGTLAHKNCQPNPEPEPDPIEKYIPISTVAAKVVSNAESGHAPSQEALRLSTVERVNTGEYDEALEAASTDIETSWKYLPIYDVAVQVKRNSIAGHAESIEAVNNSLPFELPNYEPEVVILGDVLTGELVVAEVSDRNTLPEDVSYGWYSNDELVGSEKSYQIQDSDLGKTLRLDVTYTDLDGYLENVEVKSVVGKSTKRYWESGVYPIEITLEEIPEGLVVYEDFAVKTAPMDMTISEIVKDDRLGDSYRGMVAPLDIYKDSLLKSRYATSDFKTSVEPLDITIVELIKTSREDLRYTVGLAPLDIENKEIAIHHKQSDGYKAEVIPLNIMINTKV